ncbi:hypothetical protein NLI96_g876 [Meripilus lineatus]|uniref:Protein kinase domain-containing protein n=1 Tax=Meripilus lineatus TaxID=2056292 RepID=A0AAD5VBB4_9APHY|nr:hypothetical protein NLI96_g876 [Physisporinus lineatus]
MDSSTHDVVNQDPQTTPPFPSQYAEDMDGRYVFITLDDFFRRFGFHDPSTSKGETSRRKNFSTLGVEFTNSDFSTQAVKESNTYFKIVETGTPFLEDTYDLAVTAWHQALGLSTHIAGTSVSNTKHEMRVDLAIFRKPASSQTGSSPWVLSDDVRNKSQKKRPEFLARSSWDEIIVPIEVKSAQEGNPFISPESDSPYPEATTAAGEQHRGQLLGYVRKIFEHQQRIFVFSVFIFAEWVYLIRWDRAGAVVAKPFSLITDLHMFHLFLYKLGRMTRAQQGYDDSIRSANPREVGEFMKFTTSDPIHHKYLTEARAPHGEVPAAVFRVDLKGYDTLEDLRLIFARPRALGRGVLGRATRGYIAYDMDNKRLVFLKDYWQPVSTSYHSELDTYTKLKQAGVENIATPLGGGRLEHKTITQEYLSEVQGASYGGREHYRFAVLEIGIPLEEYEEPLEMVTAILDAVQAHEQAWVAGVLHRDISCGNILILRDGSDMRGILNDWDMCKHKDTGDGRDNPAFRSGTWLFMSALLLKFPDKPHQLSDDIESFVHVINWLILRFHVDWTTKSHLQGALHPYTEHERTPKADVGGEMKFEKLLSGLSPFHAVYNNSPALKSLSESLAMMCQAHYLSPSVSGFLKSAQKQSPLSIPRSRDSLAPDRYANRPRNEKPSFLASPLAATTTKPPMDGHQAITDLLLTTYDELRTHGLEAGEGKLSDQLKRFADILPSCSSPAGGAGKLKTSSQLESSSLSAVSTSTASSSRSTHPMRTRRSSNELEDPEIQATPKKPKTGRSKRPSDIAEVNEQRQ